MDPLLQNQSAASGLLIYRGKEIPQLTNLLIFTDLPSGEMFYVNADKLPAGGQSFRRVLFSSGGQTKTLLQWIADTRMAAGAKPPTRADLRFGTGPDNQVFLLNKQDNTIRLLVPSR